MGSVITFGRFRVLDLGDLLWNNEHDLVCPRNMVGTVDLYMVTHHGLAIVRVAAARPQRAPARGGDAERHAEGGAPATFQTLRASPGLEDVWTLHWSYAGGIEHNSAGAFIANVDSASAIASILTAAPGPGRRAATRQHSPAHYIKISARADGTFTVTNTRNGFSKTYVKR